MLLYFILKVANIVCGCEAGGGIIFLSMFCLSGAIQTERNIVPATSDSSSMRNEPPEQNESMFGLSKKSAPLRRFLRSSIFHYLINLESPFSIG